MISMDLKDSIPIPFYLLIGLGKTDALNLLKQWTQFDFILNGERCDAIASSMLRTSPASMFRVAFT